MRAIRTHISARPSDTLKKCTPERRPALRPIFERLLEIGFDIGDDVKRVRVRRWCRCIARTSSRKSSRRQHADRSRIVSPRRKTAETCHSHWRREEEGDRITHRIAIESIEQINGDVTKWDETAYGLAAPENQVRITMPTKQSTDKLNNMSTAAGEKATGKGWAQWVNSAGCRGCRKMDHKQIVAIVHESSASARGGGRC